MIKDARSLTKLDMCDCLEVTDFTPLCALVNLLVLDVSRTNIDNAAFVALSPILANLEILDLSGCKKITDLRALPTGMLSKLKKLIIIDEISTDTTLAQLLKAASTLAYLKVRNIPGPDLQEQLAQRNIKILFD